MQDYFPVRGMVFSRSYAPCRNNSGRASLVRGDMDPSHEIRKERRTPMRSIVTEIERALREDLQRSTEHAIRQCHRDVVEIDSVMDDFYNEDVRIAEIVSSLSSLSELAGNQAEATLLVWDTFPQDQALAMLSALAEVLSDCER